MQKNFYTLYSKNLKYNFSLNHSILILSTYHIDAPLSLLYMPTLPRLFLTNLSLTNDTITITDVGQFKNLGFTNASHEEMHKSQSVS